MNVASLKGTAVHATAPWRKAGERTVNPKWIYGYVHDTQAQISTCLNCQMAECINCHDTAKNRPSTKRAQKMCRIRERFIELYNSGTPKKTICADLKIVDRTYYNYLKRFIESTERSNEE